MSEPWNCGETFRRLDDYLDRELSDAELLRVEEHLAACETCADEFGTERELLEAIRAKFERIKAPESLRERIRRALG